jgi:hypothetical protein
MLLQKGTSSLNVAATAEETPRADRPAAQARRGIRFIMANSVVDFLEGVSRMWEEV